MKDLIDFDLPTASENIIKVIGVGGGGSNAVNHMYRQGIKDVDFAICNTDVQHLLKSPVPVKVQLGSALTEGRGAGNKPTVGCASANENIEEIEAIFSGNTKMVFITAGMGGGTGTGAAPVIPPIPGARLGHVFPLRNPTHARAIRTFLTENKPRTAAVIGSGFIGMEMVENLTHAGLAVTLVEKLPQVCPFVDPDMAPYILEELVKNGVQVRTGLSASELRSGSVTRAGEMVLEDGSTVPADLVILAVGIRPVTDLARAMGVVIGPTGAIAVDAGMRTSLPDVYACGDCAENVSIVDGRKFYRPLGSTANKTGRIAGDVLTGGTLTHRGVAGTGIFRVFEMTVAATGLNEREARATGRDVVVSHNIKPDRPEYFHGREMVIKTLADRADGTILGVQIVGYEGVDKRIDVLVTAMTAGLRVSDLFHLDLAYAPPFSTTKDPVHYTGMILENAIHNNRDLVTADQLAAAGPDAYTVIDTRVKKQFAAGHVPGAINLPQESVRETLARLDHSKPVVTYCNKGVTGNAVQNILINRGFKKVYNMSGGFRQFRIARKEKD